MIAFAHDLQDAISIDRSAPASPVVSTEGGEPISARRSSVNRSALVRSHTHRARPIHCSSSNLNRSSGLSDAGAVSGSGGRSSQTAVSYTHLTLPTNREV